MLSLAGEIQGSFCPDPDSGFGIRRVVWHPSGMFLAIGGWDDKVSDSCSLPKITDSCLQIHILDLTWTLAATLELSARIPPGVVRLSIPCS